MVSLISNFFCMNALHRGQIFFFDVLLPVHLSIFVSVFNQLDAQNLFYNKFYFVPLHVSSTCARQQEVKIALQGLWYHRTCRWASRARDGQLCYAENAPDVRCILSSVRLAQYDMLPQHQVNIRKLMSECF